MALTQNTPLSGGYADYEDLYSFYPVAASANLYQGAAVRRDADGRLNRVTGANQAFAGIMRRQADNSSGGAGAISGEVLVRGIRRLTVTGATSSAADGRTVYATDDDVFTLTPSGGTRVGTVLRWLSGTICQVLIESESLRTFSTWLEVLEATVAKSAMTGSGPTGTLTLSQQLPAGALVLGWRFDTTVAFSGDTSATLQVGVTGNADRFSAITNGSVFTVGTIGTQAPGTGDNAFCEAATSVLVTVTSGSSFASVNANATGVLRLHYLRTRPQAS